MFRHITFIFCLLLLAQPAAAQRIKDIASVAGVRSNPLVGYGWWWAGWLR